MIDVKREIENLLVDVMTETRVSLKKAASELAAFVVERATHLATLVDDPGFQEAVRAERDAVALEAGIIAVGAADAADAQIVGVIQGALAITARLLSVA